MSFLMSWVVRFPCHFVKKSGSTESTSCTFSAVYVLHGKCAEGGVSDELFVPVYILHSIGFANSGFSSLCGFFFVCSESQEK